MTKIEWEYSPTNIPEGEYLQKFINFEISIKNGNATLISEQTNNLEELIEIGRDTIIAILKILQIQNHKKLNLKDHYSTYRINLNGESIKDITFIAKTIKLNYRINPIDVEITNSKNEVLFSSKNERNIAASKTINNGLKLNNDLTLLNLLNSYERSLKNEDNILIHLNEIRDAICTHFKNKKEALKHLNFPSRKWDKLGIICNHLPLVEGRHAGNQLFLRNATKNEIKEARTIVSELIESYINYYTQ